MKKSFLSILLACLFFTAQAEEMWHIVGTNDYVRTGCLRKVQIHTDSLTGASFYFRNIPQNPGAEDLAGMYNDVFDRLVQTGSIMPAGSGDITEFDESVSGFYRSLWSLNEIPADGGWYIWNDPGVSQLQELDLQDNMLVRAAYMRLLHNMYQQNLFLEEASKLNLYPEEQKQVRFVRALTAWYMLDLFPASHFTTQTYINGSVTISRQQLYNWLEAELLALTTLLPQTRQDIYHVDADAAKMLLARLYLNAEVYTGTPQWAKASSYAQQVMNGQHPLHVTSSSNYSPYQELFMGNNDANGAQEEALLLLKQDGNTAYSWVGSIYIINATRSSSINMPPYGINGGWDIWRSGYRLLQAFATDDQIISLKGTEFTMPGLLGDDRAMFYADDTYPVPSMTDAYGSFTKTWTANKFTGRYSTDPLDGSSTSASSPQWPDTDIPLMRSAEAWLTYAEAQFRMGNTANARNTIAALRSRANASTPATISEDYILDEWFREFYNEGRRRVDLIRFHQFAGPDATRTWEAHTSGIDASYNTFPLPDMVDVFPSPENKYRYFAQLLPPVSPEWNPDEAYPCDSCNTGEVYYDRESETIYSINRSELGMGIRGAFASMYQIFKGEPFRLELTEFPYMQPVDQPAVLPETAVPEGAFVIMLHSDYNYGANLVVQGDYLNSEGEWIYNKVMTKPSSHTPTGTNVNNQHFARFDSIGNGWYKAVVYPIIEKDDNVQSQSPGYAYITGIAYYPEGTTGKPQMIKEVHKLAGSMNNYIEMSTGEMEFSFSQLAYYEDPTYGRVYYSSMATDRVVYLSVTGQEPTPQPLVPSVDPTPGAVTLMIKFDVAPCEGNNIRFVGTYGGLDEVWSFPSAHVMTPVGDGWYKVILTPNESGIIEGRPVQCDENGEGYWNQDWSHVKQDIVPILGVEDYMIVNSGYSEWNLYFTQYDAEDGAVVYIESKAWNFTCSYPREYTITVTLPDFCMPFNAEVVGAFEGWGVNPASLTLVSGNTYTTTVTAKPGMEWKIRGEGGWDQELVYYEESVEGWYTFGNFSFGDETNIVLDFSNPNQYMWNVCL